ncbi:MAG: hypothetical protein ACJ74K_15770 [Actinomycetes bacterium]
MRREQVIEPLHGALAPLAWVNAAWLGGSDAFGRADELSDVDLQVDVDDGHVAATFGAVEAALAAASPIVARLVMPMPTWHGHAQRFYRLRDTAEFTAVDVVVFQRSDPRRYYNQTERHGRPWSCSTGPGSSGPAPSTRPSWPPPWPGRSRDPGGAGIHPAPGGQGGPPGRRPGALGLWHRRVLAPLVTLYRVRHTPARHDFGTRYTRHDLPAQVQETLAELAFVTGLDDIAAKLPAAERLLGELLDELG